MCIIIILRIDVVFAAIGVNSRVTCVPCYSSLGNHDCMMGWVVQIMPDWYNMKLNSIQLLKN